MRGTTCTTSGCSRWSAPRRQPGAHRDPGPLRRQGVAPRQRHHARHRRRRLPAGRHPRRQRAARPPPPGPGASWPRPTAARGCRRSARCRRSASCSPTVSASATSCATTWPPRRRSSRWAWSRATTTSSRPSCRRSELSVVLAGVGGPGARGRRHGPGGPADQQGAVQPGACDAQGVRPGPLPARRGSLQRRCRLRGDPVPRRARPHPAGRRLPARTPTGRATTSSTPPRWRCWPTGSAYPLGWSWGRSPHATASCAARTCTRGWSCGWPTAAGARCRPRRSWASDAPRRDMTPAPRPSSPGLLPQPEPQPPRPRPGAARDPAARTRRSGRSPRRSAVWCCASCPGLVLLLLVLLVPAAKLVRRSQAPARVAGPRTGSPAPGPSSSTGRATSACRCRPGRLARPRRAASGSTWHSPHRVDAGCSPRLEPRMSEVGRTWKGVGCRAAGRWRRGQGWQTQAVGALQPRHAGTPTRGPCPING